MKLLSAHIENFRLLRDIEIEFATESSRNLTIIRAANESGKTTLLTALQWGLYGDKSLPQYGSSFRLSPIDASSGEDTSVHISVEIDFEVSTRTGSMKYRISRFVTEKVSGREFKRERSNVNLFQLTRIGANELDYPERHIRPHLPQELREVFFTDGDRALSFIEGKKGDQMKRVRRAIRSLLGLAVVRTALDHTKEVKVRLSRKVRKRTGNQKVLQRASDRLKDLEERLPKLEEEVQEAKEALLNLEELEEEVDRKLTNALQLGDRDELQKERQSVNKNRHLAELDANQSARDHTDLFKSELLAKQLLAEPLKKAKAILNRLHKMGKIPNQSIPVLEDRLNRSKCICGETLDQDVPDGQRHRIHIQKLIDESRNADAIQEKITTLYYSSQDLVRPLRGRTWSDEYSDVFGRRQRANMRCEEFGKKEAAIEAKIAALPDVDTRQLLTSRNQYRHQVRQKQGQVSRSQARLQILQRNKEGAESERNRLLQYDKKGMKIAAELAVADDLYNVLSNTLEAMKTRELKQVSNHMNRLFLAMIGADPSQNSIIIRATITSDFRIVVFGRFDYPLDPSQDLNGASRRALTIAFILALTLVSEVTAPNVIDTPLGMMSGYVKQSVLQLASKESSQLILFLTHSEILGCEEILDQYAGKVYTLTNPAHYPKILVNDPGTDGARVLLCNCNHRQVCQVCERNEVAVLTE